MNLRDDKTDKAYAPEIRISRQYDLTIQNDGGLQLVSKGDLTIEFIDSNGKPAEKYGARHAAAVGLLSKKFNAMLKPKLPEEADDGITFKGRWARIGKLKARLARAKAGWLSLGWKQHLPEAVPVDAIADDETAGDVIESDQPEDEAAEVADGEPSDVTELVQTASIAP